MVQREYTCLPATGMIAACPTWLHSFLLACCTQCSASTDELTDCICSATASAPALPCLLWYSFQKQPLKADMRSRAECVELEVPLRHWSSAASAPGQRGGAESCTRLVCVRILLSSRSQAIASKLAACCRGDQCLSANVMSDQCNPILCPGMHQNFGVARFVCLDSRKNPAAP